MPDRICKLLGEGPVEIDAVTEKWEDALSCADTWEEKNLISEFLDDLRGLGAVRA